MFVPKVAMLVFVSRSLAGLTHCMLLHFAYCHQIHVRYVSERPGHYIDPSISPVICMVRFLQYAAYAAVTYNLHIHVDVKLPSVHW